MQESPANPVLLQLPQDIFWHPSIILNQIDIFQIQKSNDED